jgi:NDP-sugar pyrophosphorylase family protein
MTGQFSQKYPIFVMCGRDPRRRRLMEVIDPEEKYKSKALLPFLGRRLVEWQLEELRQSPYVGEVYLLGLSEADLPLAYPVHYVPVATDAEFPDKLVQGLNFLQEQGDLPDLIVVSSCDTPGIRVEDINVFFHDLVLFEDKEAVISLVPEEVIEAAFPGSGRVVARFRDGPVFPGELYALSPRVIRMQSEVVRQISTRRRQINREAKKIGMGPILRYIGRKPRVWWLLVRYALHLATLQDAEGALSAAFGIPIKGVIIPDAGFGMDMDLPEDYKRLKEYVQRTKVEKVGKILG